MKAVLTIFNSKRDMYGNVYYAVSLHSHGGEPVNGTIQPDNVDTRDCRDVLGWHIERQELPIRKFNALAKGWPYFGCGWPEIRAAILAQVKAPAPAPATPGTWEAVPDPHNASNPYWHVVDIHAGPLLVARVQCTNARGQGPANAAVLAAASDMLTALDNIVGAGAQHETTCDSAEHDNTSACIYCEARAAIAKATGGTP